MKTKFVMLGFVLTMVWTFIPVYADLGTYSWQGEWDSNWGRMVIVQSGDTVTGDYTHDKGKISGTVSGNTFIGTWSEAPSYAPDKDAGDMELTMSSDGKSFTGKWRYGKSGTWGTWEGGKRITPVILAPTTDTAAPTAAPATTGSNENGIIFDNGNIDGVQSGPTVPTTFTIDKTYMVTWMMDYHYFNNGILPGQIALRHSDGTIYGPWQTKGRTGQGNVNNAYWDATPNVQIKPGTYTIVDSDPATWSHNSMSGNKGISIIKGYAIGGEQPQSTPVPTLETYAPSATPAYDSSSTSPEGKDLQYRKLILQIDNPNMTVNGVSQEIDPGRGTVPILHQGRTVLPIRAVVEALGGTVGWDGNENKVTIKVRNTTVELWLDKTIIRSGGVEKQIDVAPTSINGRTMVPVRFIIENIPGCLLDWDNNTRSAIIKY